MLSVPFSTCSVPKGIGEEGGRKGGGGLCPCLGCGPSEMQVGTDHPLSELKLELRSM